jgi:hypothetical protein
MSFVGLPPCVCVHGGDKRKGKVEIGAPPIKAMGGVPLFGIPRQHCTNTVSPHREDNRRRGRWTHNDNGMVPCGYHPFNPTPDMPYMAGWCCRRIRRQMWPRPPSRRRCHQRISTIEEIDCPRGDAILCPTELNVARHEPILDSTIAASQKSRQLGRTLAKFAQERGCEFY